MQIYLPIAELASSLPMLIGLGFAVVGVGMRMAASLVLTPGEPFSIDHR